MMDYQALKPFAKTSVQKEAIEACIKHGSNQKAAIALGKGRRDVDKAVNRVMSYFENSYFAKSDDGKLKVAVIPDTQVKPDDPIFHLIWAAQYIADKKPDVIVMIGDWWDMPSLSSYDKGKKSFEGRRYIRDVDAGNEAMKAFMKVINTERERCTWWKPRLVFTLGNHEERIQRAIQNESMLDGTIGYKDLYLDDWEVHDFLEPVIIGGVAFCHYFTSGTMGRPVSSARALLNKKHMSSVMGHVQDKDIAFGLRADGSAMTAIFIGIFYLHNEDYLGAQGNNSWRGIWMLNEVHNGSFDEMPVSMNFLRNKYGAK